MIACNYDVPSKTITRCKGTEKLYFAENDAFPIVTELKDFISYKSIKISPK